MCFYGNIKNTLFNYYMPNMQKITIFFNSNHYSFAKPLFSLLFFAFYSMNNVTDKKKLL
jgi:hypothetical protein